MVKDAEEIQTMAFSRHEPLRGPGGIREETLDDLTQGLVELSPTNAPPFS